MRELKSDHAKPAPKRYRWIVVPALVLILGVGFYLRITGYRWGIDDDKYYHPDERGIFMAADAIQPVPVAREEGESFRSYAYRWLHTNLRQKRVNDNQRTLEPRGFHYGSFPWYLLDFTRKQIVPPVHDQLVELDNLLNPDVDVDLSELPWYRRVRDGSIQFFGKTRFGGPVFRLIQALRQEVPPYPVFGNKTARVGRFISAFLGALTLWVIYLFGARYYNWKVGLIAAFLLMLTVTHIQLCHYYCFDSIQAFFILLALYFMARVAESGKLTAYLLSALFIGLSIATKFSSLPIVAVLLLAHLLIVFSRRPKPVPVYQEQRFWFALATVTIPLTLAFFLLVQVSHMGWVVERGWLLWMVVVLRFIAGLLWFLALCFQIHLWNRGMRWASVVNPWVYLLLALWFSSRFTFIFQPYAFIDPMKFWGSINEQRQVATVLDFRAYTVQYRQTYAYFYHLGTMFHRTLGYPLAITCFAGVVYLVWRQFRKTDKTSMLLLAWVLGFFLVVGRFHVKFPRYVIPIIPPLVLIGAKFLVDLLDGELVRTLFRRVRQGARDALDSQTLWAQRARFIGVVLLAVTGIYTWAYAFAFVRIYKQPHNWKVASYWIFDHAPRGSSFLWENWGDPLPQDFPASPERAAVSGGAHGFRKNEVGWYPPENIRKITDNMRMVSQADYITICSKRAYGSILRAPERSPYANNYYRMLFAEQLGFRLEKVVETPIRFLGLTLYDDLIDESFRLYDHPKVLIFKKVRKLDTETLTNLVMQPPDWVNEITLREILTVHDGGTVYQQKPSYPIFTWYITLFILGLIAFPFLFLTCPNLRDRGYAFSKTLGILVVGYFAWLLPALGMVAFSRTEIALVLTILVFVAIYAYYRQRKEIGVFLESNLGELIFTEIVFFLVFLVFIRIRMWNPDIHWGEKPMDISLLSAMYRTDWFPPEDPWIAGKPINYYYYGYVLLGVLGKLSRMPPEYCFNLALGTIPALVFVSAYGIVRTLTRKRLYGLLSGYLLCFAGSLAGFAHPFYYSAIPEGESPFLNYHRIWSMVRQSGENVPWWDRVIDSVADGRAAVVLHSVGDFIRLLLLPFEILWRWVTGAALPEYSGLGFNNFFWDASRIIKSTVANEFPYWTFLFADLHPHMIVIPFSMLFIGLCVNALRTPRGGLRLWGSGWTVVLGLFISCLALGSSFCINSWDFPTLVFFLVLVLVYRGWHYRSAGTVENLRLPIRMARYLGVAGDRTKQAFVWVYGVALELALPLFVMVVTAIMLYVPFHNQFYPRVALGPGSARLMRSGWTKPTEFFFVFGLFGFIALVYLIVKLRDLSVVPGRRRRWWPWAALIAVAALTLLVAQLVTWRVEPGPTDRIHFYTQRKDFALFFYPHQQTGNKAGWVYRRDLDAARGWTQRREVPTESDNSRNWGQVWQELKAYPKNLLLGRREGPYYGLASLLLPWLLLVFLLLLLRRYSSEEHTFLIFLAVALSVLFGGEIIYIYEGWAEPQHRWNSVFKFYMHVWIFFSLAAPGALHFFRRRMRPMARGMATNLFRSFVRGGVYGVMIVMLMMSFAFTVFAAYTVTAGPGAHCVRSEERPTLDGLSFWKARSTNDPRNDAYQSFHWLRRFIHGTPTMVEGDCETGPGQTYSLGGFPAAAASCYTGIPALLGWGHHSNERYPGRFESEHRGEIRRRLSDQKDIFKSSDKRTVIELLRRWQVDLVYIGLLERRKYPGIREKFNRYGDVLDLLYETDNVSIFRTRQNINAAFLGEVEEVVEPEPKEGENAFQAGEGSDPGYMSDPHGVAVDPLGRIIVADTRNHRIQVFKASGEFTFTRGREGAFDEEFNEPHDVATDASGNIYVADTWNSRLKKYSPDGKLLGMVGSLQASLFYGPRSVAVDSEAGRIYVADTGHHTIQVFDMELRKIASIGSRGTEGGKLDEPTGVTVGPGGEILVAEMHNKRVSVFNRDGEFLRAIVPPISGENIGNEMRIAVSKQGHVYITDPAGARIYHYTLGGDSMGIIDTRAHPEFRALKPTGIAIDAQGRLLVADRSQNLIVRSQRPYP